MSTRSTLLALALTALLLPAPLRADTFDESFDDGAIDPSLLTVADPGFALAVTDQELEVGKAGGTGNGEVLLRSRFVVAGDFSFAALVERTDLAGGAELGIRARFPGNEIAEIFLAGADLLKASIAGPTTSAMGSAATVALRVRRDDASIFCDADTGLGFEVKNSLVSMPLSKAKARVELFLRQTTGSTLAHTGRFDDLAVAADQIQGGGNGGATPTAAGPTPTPRPSPVHLDHFTSYGVKHTKGTAPFAALGPITLLDGTVYDVLKIGALLVPADKNGEGLHDAATHLLEYRVKLGKGAPKPAPLSDVRVLNQCHDVLVQVTKPVSLLVPTAKSLESPVEAPVESSHERDHLLCFQVKAQKKRSTGEALPKLPKGTQALAADQFDTRRYDLVKPRKICLPTSKSGSPSVLKGPAKGQPFALTPSSVRHADEVLFCYTTKLATKEIPQLGCGAADPASKGTKITPKQSKHAPRIDLFVASQLGTPRLDTTKVVELCVPSFLELPDR